MKCPGSELIFTQAQFIPLYKYILQLRADTRLPAEGQRFGFTRVCHLLCIIAMVFRDKGVSGWRGLHTTKVSSWFFQLSPRAVSQWKKRAVAQWRSTTHRRSTPLAHHGGTGRDRTGWDGNERRASGARLARAVYIRTCVRESRKKQRQLQDLCRTSSNLKWVSSSLWRSRFIPPELRAESQAALKGI